MKSALFRKGHVKLTAGPVVTVTFDLGCLREKILDLPLTARKETQIRSKTSLGQAKGRERLFLF